MDAPDEDLVRIARAKRPDARRAFAEIVRRYQAPLVRYAAHLLQDASQAEDTVQESLVKAFLDLGRLREGEKLHGWLRAIVTRRAFNHRRARQRRRDYEGRSDPPLAIPLPDGHVEANQLLLLALAELSYPFREVLLLRHLEELSVAEIARTLSIGESAAKMRLMRARQDFFTVYDRLVRHAK